MIGKKIKQYLEDKGIKQAFLAEKIGVTTSQMNLVLNKGRKIDCVTYYKICRVLDVPLEYFMEGDCK